MVARVDMSMGRLIAWMALYVIVGVPMVAYLWETLNDLMQLQADTAQVILAVPVLLAFAGWLVLLARRVRRWTAADVR